MQTLSEAAAAIKAIVAKQETPQIDPTAILQTVALLVPILKEIGIQVKGKAEMEMEGLDPLTGLGSAPARYRVVIEFTL